MNSRTKFLLSMLLSLLYCLQATPPKRIKVRRSRESTNQTPLPLPRNLSNDKPPQVLPPHFSRRILPIPSPFKKSPEIIPLEAMLSARSEISEKSMPSPREVEIAQQFHRGIQASADGSIPGGRVDLERRFREKMIGRVTGRTLEEAIESHMKKFDETSRQSKLALAMVKSANTHRMTREESFALSDTIKSQFKENGHAAAAELARRRKNTSRMGWYPGKP